jgi:hypothetical protein
MKPLALVLLLSGFAAAYPEPAVVQNVKQWTLSVEYPQPEQLMLRMDNRVQRFWYIILTVTNMSDFDEVAFYPVCELMTDTFEIIPADRSVPRAVFDIVRERNQGRYPFLESLDFIDHRVFKGPDNARDFAIIWPDFDPAAREISLFIGGLSNETAVLSSSATPTEDQNEQTVLQKTLWLKYAVGGDQKLRQSAVLQEIASDWIMR